MKYHELTELLWAGNGGTKERDDKITRVYLKEKIDTDFPHSFQEEAYKIFGIHEPTTEEKIEEWFTENQGGFDTALKWRKALMKYVTGLIKEGKNW